MGTNKKKTKMKFNSIEEAIVDIKIGKVVIVVDDENRENEGDFVAAAEMTTPSMINFMATHGRGLICTPLIEERCDELGLEMMVDSNNSHFDTPQGRSFWTFVANGPLQDSSFAVFVWFTF